MLGTRGRPILRGTLVDVSLGTVATHAAQPNRPTPGTIATTNVSPDAALVAERVADDSGSGVGESAVVADGAPRSVVVNFETSFPCARSSSQPRRGTRHGNAIAVVAAAPAAVLAARDAVLRSVASNAVQSKRPSRSGTVAVTDKTSDTLVSKRTADDARRRVVETVTTHRSPGRVIAKFHYTGPTGPARTRTDPNDPDLRETPLVRAGLRQSPRGSVRVRSGPCSGI